MYLVIPNSFSPKYNKYSYGNNEKKVHSISYNKCNFDCEYCAFHYYKHYNKYKDYPNDKFEKLIDKLLLSSNYFKFTGGEPTLNPQLYSDLQLVKSKGGKVFLDTNGFSPERLKPLLDNGLVDIMGISIKGLSQEEACKRSGVSNDSICWENVLKSIMLAATYKECDVIITYVCYSNFNLSDLECFAELIKSFPDVHLKINNYIPDEHCKTKMRPMDLNVLEMIVNIFIDKHNEWKDRITVVGSRKAVSENSEVLFL